MAEWAYLPEGVLDHIISKLFDQDRYNFRLVCRSWKAATAFTPYPINAPCLIHYDRKKRLWGFFQYNSFFYRSFPDDHYRKKLLWRFFQNNSFFYRSFPEFHNAQIFCCKYGWLLMGTVEQGLFFFNPFNRHTEPIVYLNTWRKHSYTSIHFFHPPTSHDCFIIGVTTAGFDVEDGVTVDILRYGEKEWDRITYHSEHEFLVSNCAPILQHGIVYFLGARGEVATLDIQHRAWTVHPKSLEFRKLRGRIKRQFLLKINGDHTDTIYAVFMIHRRETVNVFRLLKPKMKWERIQDLGDNMLYLSLSLSFGDVAKPKIMANTICFPIFDSDNNPFFYSLKTQKYHSFDGRYTFDSFHGLTRLFHGVTWITPIPSEQLTTSSVWYPDNKYIQYGIQTIKSMILKRLRSMMNYIWRN